MDGRLVRLVGPAGEKLGRRFWAVDERRALVEKVSAVPPAADMPLIGRS